ncbi:MAG: type VI secretion system membrane subunit TssM [Pseudomonadales bacterium]
MRKLFGFFKSRWLVSIIGLIAVALLIWYAGPLVAIAGKVPLAEDIIRIICILAVVLLWALNNLRIQMRVNRANSQLMGDASLQLGGVADSREQHHGEAEVLRERFEEALQVLKTTSKQGKVNSIYDMPWYIIIGPPGSGKTTALMNSGLSFPLAEKFGKEALRGIGGTRNCDWWFTNQAVLIDTAGRYTTQDSDSAQDSAAWESFLSLLKTHRKRKPINGVLLSISLADLLTQSEHEREQHVRAVRQRLQELDQFLGVRFPVYLLLTKCDMIAGFNEFFEDLGAEAREQVWGFTFALTAEQGADAQLSNFEPEFNQLVDNINDRTLARINQERDPQRCAKIFGFPQQLLSVRPLIRDLLAGVFRSSRYEESPLLRGVYFTCGTQEGAPIDRITNALANTFGFNQQSVAANATYGKSYFLNRLLKDVIFEEAELVGGNRKLERRRRWVQAAAYSVAFTTAGLAALAWTTSFTRNQLEITQFDDRLSDYQEARADTPKVSDDVHETVVPLNYLKKLEGVYGTSEDGNRLLMGFGLYQGGKLSRKSEEVYQRELSNTFLPAVAARLEEQIPQAANDSDLQYETLKTYLMLSQKEYLDPELVRDWLEVDWSNVYADDAKLQGQLQAHLNAMLNMGFTPITANERLVKQSRQSLKRYPLSGLLYGRMQRDYEAEGEEAISALEIAGTASEGVFVRRSGKGLDQGFSRFYSNEGYCETFKKHLKTLSKQASDEQWVLDDKRRELSKPEIDRLRNDIQLLYFSDYIRAWEGMLADLNVKKFSTMNTATATLNTLSSPMSPIRATLENVALNTSMSCGGLLEQAQEKVTDKAKKSRLERLLGKKKEGAKQRKTIKDKPQDVVKKHFALLNGLSAAPNGGSARLDGLIDLLSELYGQFDELTTGFSGGDKSVVLGPGGAELLRRVRVRASRQPQPVKRWMEQISTNSGGVAVGGAKTAIRSEINSAWAAQVLPACQRSVSGRYPVYADSDQEMTLADFGKLFAPGGLFDTFYQTHLAKFVQISGDQWRWRSDGGVLPGMSSSVLTQFKRAALIRDSFFAAGGNTPNMSFSLKPSYLDANVRSFKLDIDGQSFRYRHGPVQVKRAVWPGPNGTGTVRLEFEDDSGARLASTVEGPWAWFRLLDDSDQMLMASDELLVSFVYRNRRSTWELRADSVLNPFSLKALQQFRCLSSL